MSNKIELEIINTSSNPMPFYATQDSAGMDLRANLEDIVTLKPLQRQLIPTGLFMALPQGCEGQIRPRSGLALKQGLTVLNSPGTIDSDYRGEIKVLLINLSDFSVQIANGDRIAQMVIAKYEKAQIVQVKEISSTQRGGGGFGHSGVK
jgi:deoxyuridine 5''-triphosphate nucleotidohydrolase (dut)